MLKKGFIFTPGLSPTDTAQFYQLHTEEKFIWKKLFHVLSLGAIEKIGFQVVGKKIVYLKLPECIPNGL